MEIRLATPEDVPAIAALIPLSARELSRGFYTQEQTEAAIRHVFDGYVAEWEQTTA